jgi:hypothetical protein
MKKIILILSSLFLALLFSACGGGDGEGHFDTGEEKIAITSCETYITIQDNDLLVKDDSNTTVKIVHDSNGTKTICVVTGSAHLIREN